MRAKKKDSNHNAIAAEFESFGCWVLDLSMVGNGCPDMLVADTETCKNFFVEAKAKYGKRNQRQIEWAEKCKLPTYIFKSKEQVREFMLKGIYDENTAI